MAESIPQEAKDIITAARSGTGIINSSAPVKGMRVHTIAGDIGVQYYTVDRATYIEVSAGQKQLVLANSDADAAEKLALMLP